MIEKKVKGKQGLAASSPETRRRVGRAGGIAPHKSRGPRPGSRHKRKAKQV